MFIIIYQSVKCVLWFDLYVKSSITIFIKICFFLLHTIFLKLFRVNQRKRNGTDKKTVGFCPLNFDCRQFFSLFLEKYAKRLHRESVRFSTRWHHHRRYLFESHWCGTFLSLLLISFFSFSHFDSSTHLPADFFFVFVILFCQFCYHSETASTACEW